MSTHMPLEMPPADPSSEPTALQRRAMRTSIVAQCFGSLGGIAFTSNLMLLYLAANNVPPERIVLFLALPAVAETCLRIPAAHWADRRGKKFSGMIGLGFNTVGFAIILGAGWLTEAWREAGLVTGIVMFAGGNATFAASWFALLSPIVPEALRGRYFGRVRFAWQTVGIGFATLCALLLSESSPVGRYQWFLAVVIVGLASRMVCYTRLPELELPEPNGQRFREAFGGIIRTDGYMSFCAYVFLLALFTVGCPTLFGLVEKKAMGLGDARVAWMGNFALIGSMVGFALGGKLVDRFGTKSVFLVCHFGYGAVLLGYICRAALPVEPMYVVGVMRFAFGLVAAASSIAISTELLALIPPTNKSLSTSVCMTLARGGGALSGVFSAWVLKLGMLQPTWELAGMTLSSYDALLLACGVMVIILVVTLGLVPSVIGKSRWFPRAE